jgi:hypothetical protein
MSQNHSNRKYTGRWVSGTERGRNGALLFSGCRLSFQGHEKVQEMNNIDDISVLNARELYKNF